MNNIKKKTKQFFSIVLSIALLTQGSVVPPSAKAADSAKYEKQYEDNGIYVDVSKSLEDYDNGVFMLSLKGSSFLKEENRSRTYASTNGTFVVDEAGYYLVELWGGKGANGEATGTIFSGPGGLAGGAGYVYGYLWLEEGQTLVYHIGSNGRQTTRTESGGGANGDGGDHGETGSITVGGGGGYSAVYLFEEERTSSTLTESERLSNNIMIAGGGGGGGAGATGAGDAPPSGGNGGNIISSAYGTLTANDNNGVAGTFFRGTNGRSSGSSTNYVGRAGGSVPGRAVQTIGKEYSSESGNDWTGSYDNTRDGGAGGAGNLRGGGGGAGFCGASGGIMEGILVAFGVGGGGGGSSFIADKVTWKDIPENFENYLQSTNNSTSGGSCIITYLGTTIEDTVDCTYLTDVTLTGSVSTYFDIVSIGMKGNAGGTETHDVDGNITISGVNISPDEDGFAGNSLEVNILVRPKTGFAGGNHVPVIGEAFVLTCSDGTTYTYEADVLTDYANVPLDFEAIGKSYMSSDTTKSYTIASLYQDNYATVRGNLSSYWQYDFISSISTYTIQKEGTTTNLTGSVSPTTTTKYTVGFTVTPITSNGTASVGKAVTTTRFTDTATISIVSANKATLNDVVVTGTKGISFNGTNYEFDVTASIETPKFDIPARFSTTTATTGSYEVTKTGWYYIQVWGGDGGNSGSSTVKQAVSGSDVGYSGTGGKGGYNSGYVYLEDGQIITYQSGTGGTTSSSSTVTLSNLSDIKSTSTSGGSAGGYSYVTDAEGNYLLISGAGGGAGGSAAIAHGRGLLVYTNVYRTASGRTGNSSTTFVTDTSDMDVFGGTGGGRGTAYYLNNGTKKADLVATSGSAGEAGANFVSPNFVNNMYDATGSAFALSQSAIDYAASLGSSKTVSTKVGQVIITCLETEEAKKSSEKMMAGVGLAGTFSRYFDIEEVVLDTAEAPSGTMSYNLTENADGTTRYDITDMTFIPIMHQITTNSVRQIYYTADPVVTFELTPKEGFLGGNDVPVLVYDVTEPGATDLDGNPDCGVKITLNNDYMWLPASDPTDYVNVAINYPFSDDNFATQNVTITCGESIDQKTLITANRIPMPTGNDAWKAEFVEAVYPTTTTVSPTESTTYQFAQQVAPKTAAQKAQVVSSVKAAQFIKPATVCVQYSIANNMNYLMIDGESNVLDGEDLVITIKPVDGYLLPDSIGVAIGGTTLSTSLYSYDSESGALFVDEQYITGNIVLTGAAKVQTYKLTYIYEQADGSIGEHIEEYESGTALDFTWYDSFNASVATRKGYEYVWQWETEDDQPLSVMPAQNWFVIGTYMPLTYTLTVNYYKVGTTDPVADTYTQKLTYQSEYSVVSPVVDGYTPDDATVTGVLEEDTVINVYYTPNDGKLTVFYIYTDSNTEVRERLIKELATDETYTVQGEDIPTITGYTPNQTSIEVTMPATGGVNVYIYYNPNLYTVTFEPGEGILASGEETKTVVYNNIYGYNQDSSTYGELPQPMRNGFEFTGWVDANGNAIDEETIVSTAGDHTLTATWKAYSFKLTIYYQYTDGSEAKPTVIQTHEYGALYDVDTPEITGYTADITEVSGTMGAGNRVVFITYTINIYTIVVHYVGPNGETMAEDYVTEQEYNTDYSIVSPEIPGYTVDKPIVSGVVGAEDIEVTVNYAYIDYTVTVNYVLTEGPGTQPESVVMEYMHIGDIYSIDTPEIEGYTPSQTVVEGTVGTSDIIVTVTYSLNSHSLIIQYQYGALIIDSALTGTAAATSVSTTLSYGEEYAYTSPVIEGYIADLLEVSGTMPDENVIITVYYNQVVSVTVSWGNLTYDYTESEWAPETHEYFIPPETEGSNYVTVANQAESTTKINASISYAANEGFESVDLYFTESEEWLSERYDSISTDVGVDDKVTYWIWLMGNMPNIEYPEEIQEIGICTVTIGGAS